MDLIKSILSQDFEIWMDYSEIIEAYTVKLFVDGEEWKTYSGKELEPLIAEASAYAAGGYREEATL